MTSETSLPSSPPALRLRGPVDLLVTVPYLLGFEPDTSTVVVALDARGQVAVVARVDLPGLDTHAGEAAGAGAEPTGVGDVSVAAIASRVGRRVGSVAARAGASQAVAVLYPATPDGGIRPDERWRGFASALRDHLGGVELVDCLMVLGRRWWSLLCAEAACCPALGRALPAAGTTEAEADAVLAGLAALPGRGAVAGLLAPAAPARRGPVEAVLAAGPVGPVSPVGSGQGLPADGRLAALRDVDEALRRRLAAPRLGLGPGQAAALLRAVSDTGVRDAVSWCQNPGQGGAAVSLWTELVRLAPQGWRAGPASLLAAAAYQTGSGVLAAAAAQAAMAEDPGHVLAGQLARALDAGMSPMELEPVFRLGSSAARASIEAMA
jgi:Domain of unknown function (DUF4192)